jgi:hypothetical protein
LLQSVAIEIFLMSDIGPFDHIFLNDTANLEAQPDGAVVLYTGGDGVSGSQFTFTAEGKILVDGSEYAGPAPAAPAVPAFIAPILLNSWKNHGDTANYKQSVAGYRKHADGTVELTGLVDGGAVGTNIFNLPAGYRPANQKAFAVCCAASGDTIAFIKIQPNGNVLFSTGTPNSVFLTGVRFPLA